MAKILFIHDFLFEYHGIEVVSALLKQHGHQTDILITNEEKGDIIQKVKEINPDLVSFSIMSMGYRWAIDLAHKIKKELGIKHLFGGSHPTFYPDMIKKEQVDLICCGEGEQAILKLANSIDNNWEGYDKIPGIWVNNNGTVIDNGLGEMIENIDELRRLLFF